MPEIGTIIFAQYFSDIWPVHQEQFEALARIPHISLPLSTLNPFFAAELTCLPIEHEVSLSFKSEHAFGYFRGTSAT
jgi:hypothetical protein